MAGDQQNHLEPVKTYPPWVGVVLSFFISGTSHFLSGKKAIGITWFFAVLFSVLFAVWCLTSSLVPGDLAGLIAWIASIYLSILMLVKSYRPIPRLRFPVWCGYILIAAFINLFLLDGIHFFFRPYKMPTGSMSPTIHGQLRQSDGTTNSGDHFIVESYAYWLVKPSRGDVVAFETKGISPLLLDNQIFLKRVIGIPGDVLSIQDGHLLNHGQPVTEPPSLAKLAILNSSVGTQPYLANATDTFVVSNNCYFVVGDNTTNSFDSRYWGALPEINIIGKVSKIYWPLNHAGNVQ
jgi:signal peptidase I